MSIIHENMVRELTKGSDVLAQMTPQKANLLHMVIGISGEAGEIVDVIKKHAVYNGELDIDHLIEELGDMEFFLEGLRQELKLSRAMILGRNVKKLRTRYPEGYADQAAIERADKLGGEDGT